MHIKYHKNFVKSYKKRFSHDEKIQKKYTERIKLFIKDSESPILRDHQLTGKKVDLRSFSITGDIRVVYTIIEDIVYFLDIGTHNQVYK